MYYNLTNFVTEVFVVHTYVLFCYGDYNISVNGEDC